MRILTPREAHARIMECYGQYQKKKDRNRLEEIQGIVDVVGRAFEIRIPQKDGIPQRVRFEPRKAALIKT